MAAEEPLFCVVIGSGMVGSACAASVAALGRRGRVALVGPAAQKSDEPPFSSHDDYSRVVSVVKSNIGGAPGVHDLALESACAPTWLPPLPLLPPGCC